MEEFVLLKKWAEETLFEDKVDVTIFKQEGGRTIYRLRDARLGNRKHRTGWPILAVVKEGKPQLLSISDIMTVMSTS